MHFETHVLTYTPFCFEMLDVTTWLYEQFVLH